MKRSLRAPLIFFLLPLLLLTVGFESDAQTSTDEVQRQARFVPELNELLSHPTVKRLV